MESVHFIPVSQVKGCAVDDPGFARIVVRVMQSDGVGNVVAAVPAHIGIPKGDLDALISAAIAAKGYFDWPERRTDTRHVATAVEVFGAVGPAEEPLVLLTIHGPVAATMRNGAPTLAGHVNFLLTAEQAEFLARELPRHVLAARPER